eukprot:TRINITY_DN4642_c0_g1_i1.p1 TRINITY_DN4642_c0_g1~~TRINITY_DN4642_c0_g1_i1.p1  ORF type:complete len:402 (+),score=105.85 TRINITY_DN4642_c0_g1_i1:113-1318(+)
MSSDRSVSPPTSSGMDTSPLPPPGPPGSPQAKVWPGTYRLGRDEEAVDQAQDHWDTSDPRGKRLIKVVGRNGVTFEYISSLGRGAQGYVFKCREVSERPTNGRLVALKCFSKRRLAVEQEQNSLRNPSVWHEFQLLRRVKHSDHIVAVDDTVLETDHYFFVPMEFVEGKDLHHLLWPSSGKLDKPPIDVRKVFKQIMLSLNDCHAAGVAHRDLKPSNIMLSADSSGTKLKAKVMDFGLGAEVPTGPDGKPMKMKRPVGTTAWCAPEILDLFGKIMQPAHAGGGGGMGPQGLAGTQWQEDQDLGYYARPADIWSAGVILWEMLTLDHLFHRPKIEPRHQGSTENRLVRKWTSMPESLEDYQKRLWSKLEPGAQELLKKMLRPNPKERPTSQQVVDDPWLAGA